MSRKSRRSGVRPAPAPPAPEPVAAAEPPTDPYAAFVDREWDLHFLPDDEPELVDEKALHALMKDWRHGRATRTLGQALGDAYYALFSIVVIGAMVVNAVLSSQTAMASCVTPECVAGRTLVPWALLFGVAALSLSVASMFGPVLASAAEGFWLMEAPISRRRLLRGRLWGIITAAFAIGAALAALVAALAGVALPLVLAWALGTGATASGLMAWSALEQAAERTVPARVVRALASLAAALLVGEMVAVSAGWWGAPEVGRLTQTPWLVAAVAGAVTVVAGALAHRRLDAIRRARLLSGGSLVSGMQGAMFALDLGLARDILVEREAAERGHVRPTRGRGTGAGALVWRDLQRLGRFPKPLVGFVVSILVPYAADALGLAPLNPLIGSIALMVALIPFLGSLRVLSRTGGLARMLPFTTGQIRSATMVVPAAFALGWAMAVVPALVGVAGEPSRRPAEAALLALAMGGAGLLGSVRWQTARQVDYGVPMLATGAGALPPTLLFNLFRGFDVVALITAPAILGADPLWSLGLAGVVFGVLRAGMNMEDMQAEAAEQQRLLEAEKAKAKAPEKVRIQRPAR